jgi:hypothetical protein
MSAPLWGPWLDFKFFCLIITWFFIWGALSDERTGLQFAVQSLSGPSRAGPIAIYYYHIRDSQSGGPGRIIYIPQEQNGPVIPLDTGFPLRRFLRLSGLRWRYSMPPAHAPNYAAPCNSSVAEWVCCGHYVKASLLRMPSSWWVCKVLSQYRLSLLASQFWLSSHAAIYTSITSHKVQLQLKWCEDKNTSPNFLYLIT